MKSPRRHFSIFSIFSYFPLYQITHGQGFPKQLYLTSSYFSSPASDLSNVREQVVSLLAPQHHSRQKNASSSPLPAHTDVLLLPSRTQSRSVSPSQWIASSSAGYVSRDGPLPAPCASAGVSPLIIPLQSPTLTKLLARKS